MKKQSLIPPVAPKRPYVKDVHGKRLSDEYHWMRNKDSPEVLEYLNAENAYTRAMMKPSEPLQKKLYREMLARIKETDTEVPYREGNYYYYSRTRKGQQYRIYCRKHGSLSGREQIILDLNVLGKDRPYIALGALEVSADGKSLAYSLDYSGFREYTLRIRDLANGTDHPQTIEKARSVAWAADNRTLFYVTEDEAKRASRLPSVAAGHRQIRRDADIRRNRRALLGLGVGLAQPGLHIHYLAQRHHQRGAFRACRFANRHTAAVPAAAPGSRVLRRSRSRSFLCPHQ
jgi:oligopeptidase B